MEKTNETETLRGFLVELEGILSDYLYSQDFVGAGNSIMLVAPFQELDDKLTQLAEKYGVKP